MARRNKIEEPAVRYSSDNETQDFSRAGVTVRIRGEHGTFVVKYEATHESGRQYVMLFGGLSGHAQYRTPAADRVVWPRPKRGAGE